MDGITAKIRAAKTIVIAGGGPLGTETASDIKLRYKDKRVVLVHSRNKVRQPCP